MSRIKTYMAFIDLTKAFNTVNRDFLLNILCKFCSPPTFVVILQQFHTGMCAQGVIAGFWSSRFPVEWGVKHGCVSGPVIFKLFLAAMTPVSHHDLQSSDSVGVKHCLDGSLFNLRHLKSKNKTSPALISALQYADDAAFPSLTADGNQRSLDIISETYLCASLIVNATNSKILIASSTDAPTVPIRGKQLKINKIQSTLAQISHFLVN